jgi:hypothetical protein
MIVIHTIFKTLELEINWGKCRDYRPMLHSLRLSRCRASAKNHGFSVVIDNRLQCGLLFIFFIQIISHVIILRYLALVSTKESSIQRSPYNQIREHVDRLIRFMSRPGVLGLRSNLVLQKPIRAILYWPVKDGIRLSDDLNLSETDEKFF